MKVHPDRVKTKVKHIATAGWCASSRAVCGIALRGKDVCFEMVRPFDLGDYDMDVQDVSPTSLPAILAEGPREVAVNPARA